MATSSTTGGQPGYPLVNASDVPRIEQPNTSASAQQEHSLPNAFEGLIFVPPGTGASSSSKKRYDVFINHHGEDVKDNLAKRIYDSLKALRLRVFLDKEELELGDLFPRALEEAMRGASLHIAIFSKRYAQSPWCLAELAFMLETGTTIIPVFFHVKPDILRWAIKESGAYADAIAELERKCRYRPEQILQWKHALHQASLYNGVIMDNEDDEERAVKSLVNRAWKVINKVQIIGIWGIEGFGKTTFAKEFYKMKCSAIDKSCFRACFVSDIADAAAKGLLLEKLKRLQEDLGIKRSSFDNFEAGEGTLKDVSVLIILDDVDHTDQLNVLLPAKENFGPESLIIVTTRELDVLENWGITAVYKMEAINTTNAMQFFQCRRFLQPSPLSGSNDLIKEFSNACDEYLLLRKHECQGAVHKRTLILSLVCSYFFLTMADWIEGNGHIKAVFTVFFVLLQTLVCFYLFVNK